MAPTALQGASKYLNNLLLSRGFLNNGKSIDFTQLAGDDVAFDRNSTTSQIINLIHDLVLRRDRDAEQKEALISTIHALRTEESQRVLDIQKMQDKNVRFRSELSASEAHQRSSAQDAKRSQADAKDAREQMVKLKSTLDQVRAKSISDLHKRDVELEKLRNHLSGLNCGKRDLLADTKRPAIASSRPKAGERDSRSSQPSPVGCLENESTEFMAAIINETSTENVALRKIVGDSLLYLRSLTGMDEEAQSQEPKIGRAIGIPGQYRDRPATEIAGLPHPEGLVPVQELAKSMSTVLSHCLTILRDPSFVPIEEVHLRDEEIAKLKAGWEKMADRWKEAVVMMSQLKQKMAHIQGHDDHQPTAADLENLSNLTTFGRSVATRPNGYPVLDPIEEEELTSMLMEHYSRVGNQSIISIDHTDKQGENEYDETLPEPDQTGTPQPAVRIFSRNSNDEDIVVPLPKVIASPARRGIKLQNFQELVRSPLSEGSTNIRKRKSVTDTSSPRKRRSLSPISPEEGNLDLPPNTRNLNISSITSENSTDPLHLETLTPDASDDELDAFLEEAIDTDRSRSKIPRMSVAQKLALIEAEATEATEVIRQRQATTYSRDDRRAKDRRKGSSQAPQHEQGAKDSHLRSGTAKQRHRAGPHSDRGDQNSKIRKVKDRRRSTLTSAELGTLMGR